MKKSNIPTDLQSAIEACTTACLFTENQTFENVKYTRMLLSLLRTSIKISKKYKKKCIKNIDTFIDSMDKELIGGSLTNENLYNLNNATRKSLEYCERLISKG